MNFRNGNDLNLIMKTRKVTQTELGHYDKIHSEINELMAETSRLNNQNGWYKALVSASVTLAILVIIKMYLNY